MKQSWSGRCHAGGGWALARVPLAASVGERVGVHGSLGSYAGADRYELSVSKHQVDASHVTFSDACATATIGTVKTITFLVSGAGCTESPVVGTLFAATRLLALPVEFMGAP
jgi:hypothetical protein